MAVSRNRLLDAYEALTNTSFNTIALNASNNSAGSIGTFEGGHGAITGVIFNATAITTPPTYTVSLQGVTSRGTPSGTVYGGGTATGTVIPAVGINTVTFGTAYSGTPGDQIAIVINSASAAAGATATVATRITNMGGTSSSPYAIQQSAGTWSVVTAGMPSIAPVYSDGTIGTSFVCPSSMVNYSPVSSNYYAGNAYTSTIARVCNGVYVYARVIAGSDFTVSVFSGSSTLVGTSPTFSVDKLTASTSTPTPIWVPLSSSLSMAANTTYRFVINLTTANNFGNWIIPTFSTQAFREAYSGLMYATTSPTSVSFTDSLTSVYMIVPKFETETSGGGGVMFQRGMTGGFSA
jgi:hypothetical protein